MRASSTPCRRSTRRAISWSVRPPGEMATTSSDVASTANTSAAARASASVCARGVPSRRVPSISKRISMEWRIGGARRVRLRGLPRDIAPLTRRSVSQRPITWLGVLAVAAILAATAVATVAAVRHDRDAGRRTTGPGGQPRDPGAGRRRRHLGGEHRGSAGVLRVLRPASRRAASSASSRPRWRASPPCEYLAWTPAATAGAGPALLQRQPSGEGPAPTPLSTPQERAAMLVARDTALPRMTAPIAQADGGARGSPWWRRSTPRARRSTPWRSAARPCAAS